MKKYVTFKAPENDNLYTLKCVVEEVQNAPERDNKAIQWLDDNKVVVEETDDVSKVPTNVLILNKNTGEITWGTS